LADEYAKRGQDWEVQLRQRAKELALINELGISSLTLPSPQSEDTDDIDDETADNQV
jgi:hypothetical protein